MKRRNDLFEKICTRENLFLAYNKAQKGKSKTYGVQLFAQKLESNIDKLQKELMTATYITSEYSIFTIYDHKERIIYRLPFRDRIVHHAIMNVLEPIWVSIFISNTYSCIKARGIHKVLQHLKRDLRDIQGTKYCLKFDIKKYYPSVDHDVLKMIIRKKIKDNRLLSLLDNIIDSAPGIPIGNYLSQFFANLYMAYFDHWVKEELQVKYYYRYADDVVILSEDKTHLHDLFNLINEYISTKLKLTIKSNYQVFPVELRGIDFVGYVFYHTHILMRKSIKKNFCRKAARLNKQKISEKEYKKHISPHLGWAKHCNSQHLIKKICNMKKFSDFGINSLQDKNIFAVPIISIEEVTNREIEVLDYEQGVRTKHGEDRCIVKIKIDNSERKFFTNATPIKEALSKISKTDMPFLTTVKQQRFGSGSGKTFYFT